jgi:undecaprenyl-diphosphatase
MDNIIKVIVLSLIEGVTEFLPISSTGHLIVGTEVLQFDSVGTVFEIFIQIGAVVAVIVYYRMTFMQHVHELRWNLKIRRFWLFILVAFIPAATLGLLLHEQIETVLFSPTVVAISLIVGGIVFLVVERLPQFKEATDHPSKITDITDVTFRQALIVGLVQVLALIPGMSRSGASIVGGMLSGMNRKIATEFSFFLAIPTLGGATVYKLAISLDQLQGNDWVLLAIGTVFSGIFAWFAIDWLLRYISQNSFVIFGYYRILAGLVILALVSRAII